ncbi:3,4-dihydroxy-2-butanone-4-phosphate synthase [Xanthomonas theicola]|uniref:3,4-dihydroxy-2-butanone 4-phosphate synthase n=1 Tax=Xanthomonas theicola TaxID=56464 RepID=A0A2S6ZKS0_9XANT|nr:3,4-dihydroxy-2-butanone-4-phosphate synthase [Xanthomonas theicola]PPT92867.1 3,4-dihydroxy-2-butanone-4-phosphate synthase [Xanthomonas theicola]QNH27088.1 3,4-dihydroxy-2-butanone-4-phosphate synthase [Xanthomonas theicola]
MNFAPVPELLDEIRVGRMVVIVDDEDRENEGDLIMAAELVKASDINFMVTHGRGLVCLPMSPARCAQLGLAPMVQANTAQFQTNFTVSIEAAEGVTTGISAADRAHTIRTAVRPDAKPGDLSRPGHIFPLIAQAGGVLNRAGHTEAAADLAELAGLEPAGVLVEILNPDGSMARRPELELFARAHGLKMGSIADLIAYRLATEHTVERIDERAIETEFGGFTLVTYRDRIAHDLHFALVRGTPDAATPTLVRVQVENPLADLLHWRRDDFGVASSDALRAIAAAGSGVMVVLSVPRDSQALLARLRKHPDVAANSKDVGQWRRNGAGSQILADLGLGKLRVLGTPRRQIGLAGFGLEVVEHVEPGPGTRDPGPGKG